MTIPSAVVFDLGKVLLDFDYNIASRRLAARSRLTAEQMKSLIDQSPLLFQFETGLLSRQEFYEKLSAASGFSGDLAEFSNYFSQIFQEIPEMVALHASLRARGVPTYIFSNTNEIAVEHIRRDYSFFQNNNGIILSYEHRAMKPDARLYEVVESVSGRKGADLLYIDDRPENIEAGAARGWQVILQESPAKTRLAISWIGLLDAV